MGLAPVTAPELVVSGFPRGSSSTSSRQMSGSPQSPVPGVEMSQRPLFLPSIPSESPMMPPSWGARCLNVAGGLLDYNWSMLSELRQTGLLVTGFWGFCCFGEPCCCVSCPSCLPSFLPAFIEWVCLMAKACQAYTTLHPVPTPSLGVSSCGSPGKNCWLWCPLCWPYSLKDKLDRPPLKL